MGQLIALFERTVSLYASLVNINAYHQPGVEAGKKAAGVFLDLLKKVNGALSEEPAGAEEIAQKTGGDTEAVYHCLTHLAASGKARQVMGASAAQDQFAL